MATNELETIVRITVTGNDVIAWLKLLEHPPVKPGQQTETEGLGIEDAECTRRSVGPKANQRIQTGSLDRRSNAIAVVSGGGAGVCPTSLA